MTEVHAGAGEGGATSPPLEAQPTKKTFTIARPLRSYHFESVELRYMGKTYDEIIAILTPKHPGFVFKNATIRKWFSKGGYLEKHYADYAKQENERRRRHTLEEIKKLTPEIPKKFQQLMDRKDKNGGAKLDAVTLRTLVALCSVLGFRIEDAGDGVDPLDEYFDRAEDEMKNKAHDQGTDHEPPAPLDQEVAQA